MTVARHREVGAALALAALFAGSPALAGQDGPEPTNQGAREPAEAEEPEAPFEGEFIASTIFQSGTAGFRLRSPLILEIHYFGVEDNEVGTVGLAWSFSIGRLRVLPGVAWAFGSENRPAPVVTARWTYERERWFTQGLWVQSLRAYVPADAGESHEEGAAHAAEDEVRHASILDGVHVSAIIERFEVGPLVEHIRYREEREWKGGARVAWRATERLKLVGQVLGPGAEVRGGLAWEP